MGFKTFVKKTEKGTFYTYENFLDYNEYVKKRDKNKNKCKITIIEVDFKKDNIKYKILNNSDINYIADDSIYNFIYSNVNSYYISNPSKLKAWLGFCTEKRLYLDRYTISTINDTIVNDTKEWELNFKIVDKSTFLRYSLSYNMIKLEKHIGYIIDKNKITVFSDIPLYTPIHANFLFSSTIFTKINLSNVGLDYTTSFVCSFSETKCKSVYFGENPKTSKAKNLKSMFLRSNIETIDLRNWDLSNVENINNFCSLSNVKNLYLNTNTKKLHQVQAAFSHIYLEKTNIDEIDTTNVSTFADMFKGTVFNYINLTKYNTNNLQSIHNMFYGCKCNTIILNLQNLCCTTSFTTNFAFSDSNIVKLKLGINYNNIDKIFAINTFNGSSIYELDMSNVTKDFILLKYISIELGIIKLFSCANNITNLILNKELKPLFIDLIQIEKNKYTFR